MRRQSDGLSLPYQIVTLDGAWQARVLELQRLVQESLADQDMLVALTESECERILGPRGLAAGVLVEGRLAGFYGMVFPFASDENLGLDLGLPREELGRAFHMEIAYVDPEFRGNGLQRTLMRTLVGELAARGEFRWACATVDPRNIASYATVLSLGYLLVWLKRKYEGVWRYIVFQDIERPVVVKREKAVAVPAADLLRQRALMQDGWYGFELAGTKGEPALLFAPVRGDHKPPIRPH